MIDHIAIRDKLVRRWFDRPGSVAQIAAEEFPEADAVDIDAARRHVAVQTSEITLSHCLSGAGELLRRRWSSEAV